MTRSRLARLSAGTLLLTTKTTKKALAASLSESVDEAAAEVRRQQDTNRRRAAAALIALSLLARRMSERAQKVILDGRQQARQAGTRRLLVELSAGGVTVSPGHLGSLATRPLIESAHRRRFEEDAVHASTAADSLAAAWRSSASAHILAGEHRGESPYRSIASTQRAIVFRGDRTAETETAQAFSDERREALEEAVRYDDDLAFAIGEARLVREWSALLDACPNCAPLDGTQTPIGQSFDGGAEPGFMHARCRCTDFITTAAVGFLRAA